MYLHWVQTDVITVVDLLWYLLEAPPPQYRYCYQHLYLCELSAQTSQPNVLEQSDQSGVAQPVPEKPATTEKPAPPPQVTVVEKPSEAAGLFALIIGIDNYQDPDVPDLHGAVADADAMKDFLITDLRIPAARIVNLRNEEANRNAMIDALENLAENPAIGSQDPILIFYAGHGGEAPAPKGWATSTADNTIQMLIPHDFNQEGSGDINGQGLFDITLSRILENIAKAKSDNISVIFDCCHSGSGTRDPRDETFAVRGVELPKNYTIPLNVLKSESESRATVVAKGFEKSGLRSHVLLAACMSGQTAKERHQRGAFTYQLLELLKEQGVDRLTYKDVVMRLPDLPLQNPQCEGDNQTRTLFNAKVISPYRALFTIRAASSGPGQYILDAGEAHGITNRTQFAVYKDRKMKELLGSVIAWEVTAFNTRCTTTGDNFTLPETAYALQTHVGESQDIRLFVEANDGFLDLFVRIAKEMQLTNAGKRSFRLVNTPNDEPDLAISAKNGFVQFHVMEQTCRDNGLTMMPFKDIRVQDTDLLITILHSAADFYWNLHHSNKQGVLSKRVTLECLKLIESAEVDENFDPILVPQRAENGQQVNLNVGGTIIIDVEEPAKYGFRINNPSDIPLYAALFYFDVSDLSVEPFYLPGTALGGKADISIPANGSLSISFGDSGTVPREFFLRDNQDVDVGFLKLYLSTQYVDCSGVAQPSPFQEQRATKPSVKKRYLWDSITIPVIQQKGASSGRCFKLGVNAGFNTGVYAGGYGGCAGFGGGISANLGVNFGASFGASLVL
ncbi:hypothetical protein K435DRAFT_973293 [Dendrothele bispora CBS 962.96]|uniref:Peptidase C14 caspase domain-containing protein n=1 Tax=Dendrothele bispora (strain CBS 962.96) TaxID=1314807 RepID=A0A4S8KT68_DENBC|nr:hypothetical protein K435DRAFT_973293 [Dendrothele bispora CBS 962.96]